MPTFRHPVTEPMLDASDRENLLAAFDSGWISSQGPFLEKFEQGFAAFTGSRWALATSNGTTALHLALMALNLKPGDEVIVPTFTYVATANCVRYCGATPVLVDCEPDTWNMDPAKVAAAIGPRTVGIIAVHLYGHPCDMPAINEIARVRKLWVVEDAAEAHGATIGGRKVGTFGRIATFSLYGNKIITTGEGGVVVTDDEMLARRMQMLRGQGMDPQRRYWFPMVGYNYRLTNLAAALGCSQLAKVDTLIAKHRQIGAWYREEIANVPGLAAATERAGCTNVFWLSSARLIAAEGRPELRDQLLARLAADGLETRPFFYPMHILPPYRDAGRFPVADLTSTSGFNLPSSPKLTRRDVGDIVASVAAAMRDLGCAGARQTALAAQTPPPVQTFSASDAVQRASPSSIASMR